MLDRFVADNRDAIIALARARVAARMAPKASEAELANGIPVFLDQLGMALRQAESSSLIDHDQLGKTAARHGHDLQRMGLTIGQVVHDYGDVCQSITELAVEQQVQIPAEEFRTLNLCLDDAIAGAVTEFSDQREQSISDEGTERLGALAHEMRNLLNVATLAFEAIKSGHVATGGSTGLVLGRSLRGLRDLVDRSLTDVRLDAGIGRFELISVPGFIEEIEVGAALHAREREIALTVTSVDPTVTVEGDRQILAALMANLLQNAFKFTTKGGHVSLATRTTSEHVMFDVEDSCGGLPPGKTEDLFRPYEQRGTDRSGVGLGLAICMKAAKAHGGELHARDLPGKGCVFTLQLPRKPPPRLSIVGEDKPAASPPTGPGASSLATPATKSSR